MTPVRDPQVANGTGDDAATPQAAAAKMQMLMERLKAGASFRELAAGYSEDPESAPRGGDLGFVPVSRLKQAPPQLRDAVLNKAPGTRQRGERRRRAHAGAGRRRTSRPDSATCRRRACASASPRRCAARKEQLLRAAYLTSLRERREGRQLPGAPAGRVEGKVPIIGSTVDTARTLTGC